MKRPEGQSTLSALFPGAKASGSPPPMPGGLACAPSPGPPAGVRFLTWTSWVVAAAGAELSPRTPRLVPRQQRLRNPRAQSQFLPAPLSSDLSPPHLVALGRSRGPGIKGWARRPLGPSFSPRPRPRPAESAGPPYENQPKSLRGLRRRNGAGELDTCLRAFHKVPRLRSGVLPTARHRCQTPLQPPTRHLEGAPQPGCWIGIHPGWVQPGLLWRSYCSLVIKLIAIPTFNPHKAAVKSWPWPVPSCKEGESS